MKVFIISDTHFGHINFFKQAKEHVDFLLIGLESDKTILISKGKNRPINSIEHRLEFMSEIKSVDVTFEIIGSYNFVSKEIEKSHKVLVKTINPDFLITEISTDKYWKKKEKRAKELQIGFIPITLDKINSSTNIINKLT